MKVGLGVKQFNFHNEVLYNLSSHGNIRLFQFMVLCVYLMREAKQTQPSRLPCFTVFER